MQVFNPESGGLVKAWVDGVEFEDAAKKQVFNIASMPFIYKHIAIMPDVHAGIGATVGSVIATKGAVIPAAVGVDLGCFSGDTKVCLLDGSQKTFKELYKTNKKKHFWVYSVNKEGNIVPGKAICLKTRIKAVLIKIIISGGDEIICTPDHLFMMLDGTYKQATSLKFNESLMPLYRKWQSRDGYETCTNGKGRSRLTHDLVWNSLNGEVPDGYVIHHSNHNHFDNRPENLVLMTKENHSCYHRTILGNKFDNQDPEFQKKRIQGIKKRLENPENRKRQSEIATANIKKYMNENPEHFYESTRENGKRGAPYLIKYNTSPIKCKECSHIAENPGRLSRHLKEEHSNNHKFIRMEYLDYVEDVYCLQVEEHNNFALAAGVFVHNCGMVAAKTNLVASDLPDNLAKVRFEIERAIPHGRTDNGGANDRGAWNDIPNEVAIAWMGLEGRFNKIVQKHPKIGNSNNVKHLCSLGSGNHFYELCLDEEQSVWVMLHSGSRGVGGRIGSYFIELAKNDMRKWFINLPDMDLAYFPEGTEHFDDYCEAVNWAQNFAKENRRLMLEAGIKAISKSLNRTVTIDNDRATNCHHNYISREHHFNSDVLVTRKGAVLAREGVLGIIPGSMGAKSYIVRGLGNADSFHSCSHGAGRKMSRTQAKKIFSIEDHENATKGVECRKDAGVIDETPGAYKDIDRVMEAQSDLVEIVHSLKQVLCIKG